MQHVYEKFWEPEPGTGTRTTGEEGKEGYDIISKRWPFKSFAGKHVEVGVQLEKGLVKKGKTDIVWHYLVENSEEDKTHYYLIDYLNLIISKLL